MFEAVALTARTAGVVCPVGDAGGGKSCEHVHPTGVPGVVKLRVPST
jgi:hypothetical protein